MIATQFAAGSPLGGENGTLMTLDLTTLDMAFDAIIFDCDGTLVDTIPVYARAWSQGFASSGVQMNRDWYLERAGMSEHVLLRDLNANMLPNAA
ncbi:HAD family hydrolase [Rhizobium sp. 007]|uniref:HAD family hydrolase n=1 Tax=Rhizobium sp. 007 TaxID=2785056 RepID=UPI00188E9F02|nr:HAD family hydrolase [Rhizobium sp. 007]QPB18929.1 HAD family phosphatase [Rhizobium sp. 007]